MSFSKLSISMVSIVKSSFCVFIVNDDFDMEGVRMIKI